MTVVYHGDTILYYNHAWAENKPGTMVLLKQNQEIALDVWYREKDLEAKAALYVSTDGENYVPADGEWHGTATWQRTVRCFTQKGDNLYVIEFERPGPTLTIPDMPRLPKGTAVTLLGTTGNIKWRQKKDGRHHGQHKMAPEKGRRPRPRPQQPQHQRTQRPRPRLGVQNQQNNT